MANSSKKRSFWQNHSLQITVIGLIVFILLCIGAFELGYRIAPGITLERIGTLSITDIPKDTNVYVDSQLMRTTQDAKGATIELVPGTHTVIVSVPNDYPWSSNIKIMSGKKSAVSPILVSESLSTKQLSDDAKTQALAAIASTTLPTEATPLSVANGCATLYVDHNQIIESPTASAPTCTPPPYLCVNGSCKPTIIFAPLATVDAVFPFPGRQDAIIVLLDHSLFALGLDPETPQFFAPIFHGQQPAAGILSDGTIVVRDNGTVSSIHF